jgi:hypothetical protein
LELYYNNPIISYSDKSKKFEILNRYYYWLKNYAAVRRYIRFCQICRRAKISKHAFYGGLKSLPIFADRWKDILIDFVTGFPISDKYDAILIIVDHFTKMKYLIPYRITADADNVAKIYISEIWKYYGFPEIIMLNCGILFISLFWKYLY